MVRQKLVPLLLANSFLRERCISEQRTFWGVMFEWIDPENFAQDRETAASWGSRETAAESLSSIVVTFSTHLLRPISSECCFNTLINLCVPLHCKGGVFQLKVPPAGVPVLGHHQWVFQSAISAHRSHEEFAFSVVQWFSWEGSFFWWTTAYSFFPEVFDQKKGSEGSRWEWVWLHFRGGKKQFSILSWQSLSVTSIILKERKWTVLTRFFQLSWGRGQECVLWCATCTHCVQQHCALSRTPIVLTNTASMDLGFDWFGCLKRFSRLSIINYYMCLFFLQEFGSYSAKDCLKFDWFNYNLHRSRFLRKRFAFCTLPVWRMVCVMFVRHSICSFKNIQSWSSHNQPFATNQDTASIVYIYIHIICWFLCFLSRAWQLVASNSIPTDAYKLFKSLKPLAKTWLASLLCEIAFGHLSLSLFNRKIHDVQEKSSVWLMLTPGS